MRNDAHPERSPSSWRFAASRRGWLGALGLLSIAGGLGYCALPSEPAEGAAAIDARTAMAVTATLPQRVVWAEELTAQGAIAAWQEASIGTQVGSFQLVDVRVNIGDSVRRGQVLAILNPALLRAQEAELAARQAEAAANDARARALQQAGGISDQEALQFATQAKTAAALLAAKRLELRYTSIVAPDDGVISARMATLGAVVPAGQELFRLIRQNRLEWRGELSPGQLSAVAKGQSIALALPDGSTAQAAVRQFGPTLADQSRLATVYADIAPGSTARAGMYVSGAVATGRTAALVVPAESVILRDGRNYVALAPRTGAVAKVTLRSVTTGRRLAGQIEVTEGLRPGERIVQRGAAFLNDGDSVRIVSPGKGSS